MSSLLHRDRDDRLSVVVCLALLFAGLIIDLATEQALVVAIVFNIPIALAGVLLSQRWTAAMVALAILANAGAAFDNVQASGAFDSTTVTNRLLAGLTFLLVGGLSLLFEASTDEVSELGDAEDQLARERDIRHLLTAVSGPLDAEQIVRRAAEELRELLQADAVVVTGLDPEVDRFVEPRVAVPSFSSVAKTGRMAGWAVDALPVSATPVITVRGDTGISSVGRWRSRIGQDLIVIAEHPRRSAPSELLGEALSGLEPLRDRALHDAGTRRD